MARRRDQGGDWPGGGNGPDGPLPPESIVIALIVALTVLSALWRLFG